MLDKDLTGLFRVTFQKTSMKAGKNLAKVAERSISRQWISIGTDEQKNEAKRRRWFTYSTQATGEDVSVEVDELCDALQQAVLSNEHFPALAQVHQTAAEEAEGNGDEANAEGGGDSDGAPEYGGMEM